MKMKLIPKQIILKQVSIFFVKLVFKSQEALLRSAFFVLMSKSTLVNLILLFSITGIVLKNMTPFARRNF